MKTNTVTYKYERKNDNDFFHIYTNKLDNQKAFEDALDTVMLVINEHQEMAEKHPFTRMIVYENGKILPDSEWNYNETFWEKVAGFPQCYPKVDQYIEFALKNWKSNLVYGRETSHHLLAWQLNKLAMADKRFIPFYSKCLYLWDMGHEVSQADHVFDIFEQYPWSQEIEDLIIARATCNGQYDMEQLEDFEDSILKNNTPLEKSEFFQKLVNEIFHDYPAYDDGLEEDVEDFLPPSMVKPALNILEQKLI